MACRIVLGLLALLHVQQSIVNACFVDLGSFQMLVVSRSWHHNMALRIFQGLSYGPVVWALTFPEGI